MFVLLLEITSVLNIDFKFKALTRAWNNANSIIIYNWYKPVCLYIGGTELPCGPPLQKLKIALIKYMYNDKSHCVSKQSYFTGSLSILADKKGLARSIHCNSCEGPYEGRWGGRTSGAQSNVYNEHFQKVWDDSRVRWIIEIFQFAKCYNIRAFQDKYRDILENLT